MTRLEQMRAPAAALLAAGLALGAADADAESARLGADAANVARIQIDNDLFAGRERDRDYTGGFAVTLSGPAARRGLLSLDGVLAPLDRAVAPFDSVADVHYARQAGLMVFTPGDITATEPVRDDRPYASLLFASSGRTYVEDGRTAWWSSLTVGVLGLSVASKVHDAVHDAMGSDRPRGYDYQISAGGEPTARYTLARQRLLYADPAGAVDVKATVQGSVGFLTEASAAVSMRFGRFNSAWWSFAPELTDYMQGPVPVDARRGNRETYLFMGARLKARAYNAFLQGQFRDSEVTYAYSDIEPVVAQAWVGLVMQVMEHTQLSYSLNYQTAELREGEGAQNTLWGAVQLTHVF